MAEDTKPAEAPAPARAGKPASTEAHPNARLVQAPGVVLTPEELAAEEAAAEQPTDLPEATKREMEAGRAALGIKE